MEEKVMISLEEAVKDGRFRNKSHLIEYALTQFLENRGKI